jgi:hypothetical protein
VPRPAGRWPILVVPTTTQNLPRATLYSLVEILGDRGEKESGRTTTFWDYLLLAGEPLGSAYKGALRMWLTLWVYTGQGLVTLALFLGPVLLSAWLNTFSQVHAATMALI